MATPPDFSVGQVLTAAQMNAVGLWLVKTQTVGSAVSSVSVTGAFSADYQNYRVIYTGGTGTTAVAITMQLGSSSAGYYFSSIGPRYDSDVALYQRTNNGATWDVIGAAYPDGVHLDVNLYNPFTSTIKTGVTMNGRIDYRTTAGTGSISAGAGWHNVAASYTAFTIAVGAGTLTGGTIYVYGFRD